ncbi:hypothetical protein IUY40_06165 [Flavobacterium sp. ALJ2]|uniref:DUF6046 domain-containing protein n=1 Tax=Flavobacterium sp. ALJ2 TaxID=2786960 RepID=UPI00189DEA0A|nr:DUF6046 domain-containing protein [Flavobacterium sp. ALJ2]MBF7091119.1 hypothetical protein [Flavobacterium sp. ALJ2]
MNSQDFLFSALMGSQSFKTIERLGLVQDNLTEKGLPNIPYLSSNQPVDRIDENKQYFPLSFSFTEGGTKWTFPFEPLISISSGNDITKVNVAKKGFDKKGRLLSGTIKTSWRQKDFDITITGTLIGKQFFGKPEDCFPKTHLIELFEYLIFAGSLFVYSYPLELLGITQIVIESYSFPFTKGENVQAYEIKALSDYPHSLVVKE